MKYFETDQEIVRNSSSILGILIISIFILILVNFKKRHHRNGYQRLASNDASDSESEDDESVSSTFDIFPKRSPCLDTSSLFYMKIILNIMIFFKIGLFIGLLWSKTLTLSDNHLGTNLLGHKDNSVDSGHKDNSVYNSVENSVDNSVYKMDSIEIQEITNTLIYSIISILFLFNLKFENYSLDIETTLFTIFFISFLILIGEGLTLGKILMMRKFEFFHFYIISGFTLSLFILLIIGFWYLPQLDSLEQNEPGQQGIRSDPLHHQQQQSVVQAKRINSISLEFGASIFSKLRFGWMDNLISLATQTLLTKSHLSALHPNDRASNILKKYYKIKHASLYTRIWIHLRKYVIFQFVAGATSSLLKFAGPFFMFKIVTLLQIPNVDRLLVLPYLLGLFGASVCNGVINGQLYFCGRRCALQVRAVLIDEVYRKSLRRGITPHGASNSDKEKDLCNNTIQSQPQPQQQQPRQPQTEDQGDEKQGASDEGASVGKLVTVMSVDTERIRETLAYIQDPLVSLPLTITVAICSLFFVLGWAAIAGVGVIITMGPLSALIGRVIMKAQEELMRNTDTRVNQINELLQGIRIVKYFSWEGYFKTKVGVSREKELFSLVKLFGAYILFGVLGDGSAIIIAFATFYVYVVVQGHTLTPAIAFTSINLLNLIRSNIMYLPPSVMNLFKAKVAMERIVSFLNEQEVEGIQQDDQTLNLGLGEPEQGQELKTENEKSLMGFNQASYTYTTDPQAFTLRSLDVHFPRGKLTLVCGPTGSGKSSLLLALLGEMKRVSGSMYRGKQEHPTTPEYKKFTGNVAFVSQTAWLLNATIRDNILFGCEFDKVRYERVVQACSLVVDFKNLNGGDLTEIGEKGVNVSGGQKQRISLARACYSRSGMVLLDDPLSAVDAPTARFLLHNAILNMLKGRTIILVSHATQLVLPYADFVVSIKNGCLVAKGTREEMTRNPQDAALFGLDLTRDEEKDVQVGNEYTMTGAGDGTGLVQEEEMAVGSVDFKVYKTYFIATGGLMFIFVALIGFLLSILSQFLNDWWLTVWTQHNASGITLTSSGEYLSSTLSIASFRSLGKAVSGLFSFSSFSWIFLSSSLGKDVRFSNFKVGDGNDVFYYLGIYALFGLGVIVCGILLNAIMLFGALAASRSMHRSLLKALLEAPLRFFEITPTGRILNRFSKDIESVDSNVINAIHYFFYSIVRSGTVIVVMATLAPTFLFVVLFSAPIYIITAKSYLNASRELKRLESVTKSPIYSQFSETLSGVSIIRAYKVESEFEAKNLVKIDDNHKPFYYLWASNRWLCIRTDFISAVIVFFGSGIVVFSGVDAGWAALAITYSLEFTDALLWTVRMHAEMEMSMNSVERIREYCDIEAEPPMIIETHRPPETWPFLGAINVNNVSLKYAPDLDLVLKNVTFNVAPNEKLAIVGRTGAGKSTLSLAFFRIIPFAAGTIYIDGIDISTLGLYDLRSRLTIIPQDPVLFSGTLRSNLDPLEKHSDIKLWGALNRVRFIESIQKGTESLSESITLELAIAENGSNLSQGQRQLLCLARSLLQENKIIILDEATASVDNETDSRIQETIRSEFKCTIICIAHRIRTIIDYDKILVLEKGKVAEFGAPLELIQRDGGIFRGMCMETGDFEELVGMAEEGNS